MYIIILISAQLLSNFDKVCQAKLTCLTILSKFIISVMFIIILVNQWIFLFFHYIPGSFKRNTCYLTCLTLNAHLNRQQHNRFKIENLRRTTRWYVFFLIMQEWDIRILLSPFFSTFFLLKCASLPQTSSPTNCMYRTIRQQSQEPV